MLCRAFPRERQSARRLIQTLYLMDIEHFWKALESCGKELASSGFEFKDNCWVYIHDEYKLSFEAPSDRFGHWLQVRYLTLCLAHKEIPGPDDPEPWLSSSLNMNCPVQISPALLLRFKSAHFKRRVWHYSLPWKNNLRNPACYLPVFYGGPTKWVLKDKSGSEAENRRALLETLHQFGIDSVSEQSCIDDITSSASAIAEAGKFWAECMSPSSVLAQLKRHGSDWWVEKEWIRGYQQYEV